MLKPLQKEEISDLVTLFFRQRMTNALIRLCRCADWSVHLWGAGNKVMISHTEFFFNYDVEACAYWSSLGYYTWICAKVNLVRVSSKLNYMYFGKKKMSRTYHYQRP